MRLIDADKLKDVLEDVTYSRDWSEDNKIFHNVCKAIDEQPTVEIGDKFINALETYYYECEEEYQKINNQYLPADDELTFADGKREGAYEALRRAKVMNDRMP